MKNLISIIDTQIGKQAFAYGLYAVLVLLSLFELLIGCSLSGVFK